MDDKHRKKRILGARRGAPGYPGLSRMNDIVTLNQVFY